MILAAVAALALSNGLLATLSMMRLSRLPARLREDAVYVAVAALYLGLATGATVSWGVGEAMGIIEQNLSALKGYADQKNDAINRQALAKKIQ